MDFRDKIFRDHIELLSSVFTKGVIYEDKTVRKIGTGAYVSVPRMYLGMHMRLILIPEDEADFARRKREQEMHAKIKRLEQTIHILTTKRGHLIEKEEELKAKNEVEKYSTLVPKTIPLVTQNAPKVPDEEGDLQY
jgi:putative transposon-encoded protein